MPTRPRTAETRTVTGHPLPGPAPLRRAIERLLCAYPDVLTAADECPCAATSRVNLALLSAVADLRAAL